MTPLSRFIAIGLVSLQSALLFGADTSPPNAANPNPGKLVVGAGRFDFLHANKTVPVWYYLPENLGADAPVLIVMHGVKRDADRYRDDWIAYAQKYRFILIAPEFSEAAFPGSEFYSVGGAVDDKGDPVPRDQWAFSFIEPIFDAVTAATGNRSKQYFIFGHSAGAQFVHRFLYFVPEARVAKAVAANAGWWTLPDSTVDFPYGLRHSAIGVKALKIMLQRPLTVLLGTADIDPDDANLRKTSGALAQGPNRFVRGHTFFDAGKKRAETLGVPFGWQLATAPGIGHSDSGMAEFAAPLLFGDPARPGTKE